MNYVPYNAYSAPAQNDATLARLQQLEAMQRQYQQPAPQPQNVTWIQVAGIDGAKNQIVQPGQTAWMMDNNQPMFYVKSVDGMGSATLKAFRFQEVSPDALTAPQAAGNDYVTREEFNALLTRLGETAEGAKE